MFHKLLVSNRGEVALRILRTAREMGIRTVAVYSEADRTAPHVIAADEAVSLGPDTPRSSYMNMAAVLGAVRRSGAAALHPGYGFLSESPEFATRVAEAGVAFVGPPAAAMARLGDKLRARDHARACGIPVVPALTDLARFEDDPRALAAAAHELGFPLLVKPATGSGGAGLREVHGAQDLPDAIRAARAVAGAGGAVYLEKRLVHARHIEVQVLADAYGNTVHLLERECSLQRRHQKLIEECPSPFVDADLRARLGAAAVSLVAAAHYVNAATVEFLVDPDGDFHFIEVNPRLQVEHAVTELVLGVDLVRLQVEIAAGRRLSFSQADITPRGWAMEARLNAEDPARGFLPAPGRVLVCRPPAGPGVRADLGVMSGTLVPPDYDPMIGKLIAWSETREGAAARLSRALRECVVLGVKTTAEFLRSVIESVPFRAGALHTGTIERDFAAMVPTDAYDAAVALVWWLAEREGAASPAATPAAAASPWQTLGAFAVGTAAPRPPREARICLAVDGRRVAATVTAMGDDGAWRVRVEREGHVAETVTACAARLAPGVYWVESGGVRQEVHTVWAPEGRWAFVNGAVRFIIEWAESVATASCAVTPPLPGVVAHVCVTPGTAVKRGASLLRLSAMKMEVDVVAPLDGVVLTVSASVGAHVAPGDILVTLAPAATGPDASLGGPS